MKIKKHFLVNGFREGFDIGYNGPLDRKDTACNIPFFVGDKFDMWSKIMKEVALERYAGPYLFDEIPFEHYVQSPVGLVPKVKGMTRLIFHLSYDFPKSGFKSVNTYTDRQLCTVKYNDLDDAVRKSLRLLASKDIMNGIIWYGKSDAKSAFRVLPTRPGCWWLMILMAEHPLLGKNTILLINAFHLDTALVVHFTKSFQTR